MRTPQSITRYQLARELICSSADNLAENVAITGSVSKDIATDDSDVEVNCWVADLPSSWRAKSDWLRHELRWLPHLAAVSNLHIDATPIFDGSIWASFLYKGIWFEVGYQTIAAQFNIVEMAVAGETSSHEHLMSLEAVANSLILRSSGVLEAWKKTLSVYPPLLKRRLILDVQDDCAFLPHIEACLSGSDTAQDLEHLVSNMHAFFRLLFALNERWEPNWKRVVTLMEPLPLLPEGVLLSDFNLDPHRDIDRFRRLVYTSLQRTLVMIPEEFRDPSIEHALGIALAVPTSDEQERLVS